MKVTMNKLIRISLALLAFVCAACVNAAPAAKARVKVVSVDGKQPQADEVFLFGPNDNARRLQFKGSDWSEWLTLPLATNGVPLAGCTIQPQKLPASGFPRLKLAVESTIEGSQETSQSEAELFGPQIGR